jgi:glycosyltransferase involved in cell wall biosynthesis
LWVAAFYWGWEAKGLHIFVEMARRHPELHFVVYGPGAKSGIAADVEARLRGHVAQLGNLEYRGALLRGEEHATAFCGATAFFMPTQPTIGESFGLTVIEALSKGVPVITSTAGAPPEILEVPGRHGVSPYGAACATIDEYEAALLSFPNRTREASVKIQRWAAAKYDEHIVVDKMLGFTLDKMEELGYVRRRI